MNNNDPRKNASRDQLDGPTDSVFLHLVAAQMYENGRELMAMGSLNGKTAIKTADRLHLIANKLEANDPR